MNDRRRALLAGGGKKPLYIYEPGYTAWQNIKSSSGDASGNFNTDYVRVGAKYLSADSANLNLLIAENVYKGYKKLVFTAESTNSAVGGIGWSKTSGSTSGTFTKLATTEKEYEFDISNSVGDYYIVIAFRIKSQKIDIYDMHFE